MDNVYVMMIKNTQKHISLLIRFHVSTEKKNTRNRNPTVSNKFRDSVERNRKKKMKSVIEYTQYVISSRQMNMNDTQRTIEKEKNIRKKKTYRHVKVRRRLLFYIINDIEECIQQE